jgi:hypothetical protein
MARKVLKPKRGQLKPVMTIQLNQPKLQQLASAVASALAMAPKMNLDQLD